MQLIKVGAASLNQTPLDWEGNYQNIISAIDAAKEAGVNILCLPELCITGYGCEDHFHSHDVQERALETLREIAEYMDSHNISMKVCVGLPFLFQNALYNVSAMIDSGEVLGFVAKQHLAGDGLHYEPRWFKPWPAGVKVLSGFCRIDSSQDDAEHPIPIGDLLFDFDLQDTNRRAFRVGFEICEDAWVANRPGVKLSQHGVDLILNPSASHFAFGKYQVRQRFILEGSRAFGVTYVYANLLGNEAGRAIYDGGNLIATNGSMVARGERFSFKPVTLTTAVVDIDATRTKQSSTASFMPDVSEIQAVRGVVEIPEFSGSVSTRDLGVADTEDAEDFSLAIPLALCDYMRKAYSKGFVISLSGGADSAACAVLVKMMWNTGCDTFGQEGLLKHLRLPPDTEFNQILTCMYQSTKNSSEVTYTAARKVAEGIEAKFLAIDVDGLVDQYTQKIAHALGRDLSWETDDLALQNIQARVRSPSIWMVANIEQKLLITTSNRSEAAVGYCTMDGDTSGSIAPIGGIGKAFLLKWLRTQSFFDYPCLKHVVNQQPTAELRPGSNQTDETDLMPYDVLEQIEDLAILEKKSPLEVYRTLKSQGSKPTIARHIEKFFTLWYRNQWKRERYAPAFNVDRKNLDPRSWCRFPILSGGFKAELESLREENIKDERQEIDRGSGD